MNGAGVASYAVSKAGVEAMGRALRAELAIHDASATVAHFGWVDTHMVRQGFSHPVAKRFEQAMPAFIRKRLTAAEAAAALVRGIERRAPRVITPGYWKVAYALRGIIGPLLDAALARQETYRSIMRAADDPKSARGLDGLTKAADTQDAATPAGAA
jgi:NAD(P)-dependent dehydrogenase (short-subunit alcohol dehydrogenase family)